MSDYENVVVGKLKLKGKALDVKAGGIKKKINKVEPDQITQAIDNEISKGIEETNDGSKSNSYIDNLTPAERRYMDQRQKIDMQKHQINHIVTEFPTSTSISPT